MSKENFLQLKRMTAIIIVLALIFPITIEALSITSIEINSGRSSSDLSSYVLANEDLALASATTKTAIVSINPSSIDKDYDGEPVTTPAVTLNPSAVGETELFVYYYWYENNNGERGSTVGTAGYEDGTEGPSDIGTYFLGIQIYNSNGYNIMKYIPFEIKEYIATAIKSITPEILDKVYDGKEVVEPRISLNGAAVGVTDTLYAWYDWYEIIDGEKIPVGESGYPKYYGYDQSIYDTSVGPSGVGSYCLSIYVHTWNRTTYTETKEIYFEIIKPSEIEYEDKDFKYALISDTDLQDRPNNASLVFTIIGDGFTDSAEDQLAFNEKASELALYLTQISPFEEYTDYLKIYRINVISNESGSSREDGPDGTMKDTYFKSSFYSYGMERLLSSEDEDIERANDLVNDYIEHNDYAIMIVNSEKYGGSGGEIPLISLNTHFLDMSFHEMAHTIGDLADEYYAGDYYTSPNDNNRYNQHNISHVKYIYDEIGVSWKRFIGKNGIGIYHHNENPNYVRPHQSCKMRYLGSDNDNKQGEVYPFCEVCKEGLRDALSKAAGVNTLSFQTYADVFYEDIAHDMSEYFIIRENGIDKKYGDEVDGLELTYYNKSGSKLSGAPSAIGEYRVKGVYDGIEFIGSYTIDKKTAIVSISNLNKTWDGEGVIPEIEIDGSRIGIEEPLYVYLKYYDSKNNVVSEHFYGDEHKGPSTTGKFTLKINVYTENKSWDESSDFSFEIKEKVERIVNNTASNTRLYWGEQEGYVLKPFIIMGEGFTEEDYDKFEKEAKEFTEVLFNTEPFKELKSLFNIYYRIGFSNESGVTKDLKNVKDTRYKFALIDGEFKSSVSESGLANLCNAASKDGYSVTPYFPGTIVLVNEDEIKANYTDGVAKTSNNPCYVTTLADPSYSATIQDMVNYFVGKEIGYEWLDDEEKTEEVRIGMLKKLYWSGYPIITSKAYNNKYLSGRRVDLSDTFNVYANGKLIVDTEFDMTYYEDNNGVMGKSLEDAPSSTGTYWAQAHYNGNSKAIDKDGGIHDLDPARGVVKFNIQRRASSGSGSNISGGSDILNIKVSIIDGAAKAKVTDNDIQKLIDKLDNAEEITLLVNSSDDVTSLSIELSKNSVMLLNNNVSNGVKIDIAIGDIFIPTNVLNEILNSMYDELTVALNKNEDNTIKIEFKSNGKELNNLSNIIVSIPLKVRSGEVVVIVGEDGTETIIKNSIVQNGEIKFIINGSSTIKIINNEKQFNDIDNHWAKYSIDFVTSRELFNGTGQGTFEPNGYLTRAMFVTVLSRYADGKGQKSDFFNDVDGDSWYSEGVYWAANNGIVYGTGSGFNPNGKITREELAVMMYRYARYAGLDTSLTENLSNYIDSEKVSDWSSEAMQWAVATGLITGRSSNSLDPSGLTTRAEAAEILQRYIRNLFN